MELNAFTSRLGIGQGRIRPKGAAPSDGDYVFVLGEDDTGRFFELAPGDWAKVTQSVDVTGAAIIRVKLRFRIPASLPEGLLWEASLIVDDNKYASVRGTRGGADRVLTDLVANVSKLTGAHDVGVRLELMNV